MVIIRNNGGVFATNAYLVADEMTKEAVLFDAPNDTVTPLLDEADRQGWQLKALWLTHGHIDHIADHAVVTERFPAARVAIHALDEPKLRAPMSGFALPFQTDGRSADDYLFGGQRLNIGRSPVDVIFTPGHSPGHVMFYLGDVGALIGGDVIIMGSVGRTDFPDSKTHQLYESIRRLKSLPPATQLLPGHGVPSTLAEEFEKNLAVRDALTEQ